MDLKDRFETETGEGIGFTEGKVPEEHNGTYNDAYVEWLEKQCDMRIVNQRSELFCEECKMKFTKEEQYSDHCYNCGKEKSQTQYSG